MAYSLQIGLCLAPKTSPSGAMLVLLTLQAASDLKTVSVVNMPLLRPLIKGVNAKEGCADLSRENSGLLDVSFNS